MNGERRVAVRGGSGMAARLVLVLSILLGGVSLAVGDDAEAGKRKRLRNFVKTDTVQQSGDGDPSSGNVEISPAADPFAFQQVNRIRKIEKLSITVTLDDAETEPGDNDVNQLILALDGIDTGIALNGFRSGGEPETNTISGVPANRRQILAALKADGHLAATIIDRDPGDNGVSVPATFQAQLKIKGKSRGR